MAKSRSAESIMPTKIVHLVYSFNIGGLERVIANLINSSIEDNVEHIIITLVPEQDFADRLVADVSFYCLDKQPGNDFFSHWRLLKLLKVIKPDVLHTYNFGTFEYHLTAFLAGVKCRVHAEHGRDGEYDEATRKRRTLVRKVVLPFLDHFIVCSPDLYEWANQDLKLSEPKLQLVFNGIDVDEFGSTVADPDRVKRLVTVGRIAPVKNQALLIEAYAKALILCPALKAYQLHIIGDGPLKSELESKIAQLGLEQHAFMLGAKDNIPQELKNSDLFILSSDYEAMPMTVLEAMASGVPVICTNVGGVRNIIEDGQTGLLVDSGDADKMAKLLVDMINSPERFNVIAQNARSMVRAQYSVDVMKKNYFSLYQCLS